MNNQSVMEKAVREGLTPVSSLFLFQ